MKRVAILLAGALLAGSICPARSDCGCHRQGHLCGWLLLVRGS
jgi:hypothetical protein